MQLQSSAFKGEDCSPADFVELSLAWTLGTVSLGSSLIITNSGLHQKI